MSYIDSYNNWEFEHRNDAQSAISPELASKLQKQAIEGEVDSLQNMARYCGFYFAEDRELILAMWHSGTSEANILTPYLKESRQREVSNLFSSFLDQVRRDVDNNQ